jgi:hypothetical protein
VIERFENRLPSQFDDLRDFACASASFADRLNTYVDGIRRVSGDWNAGFLL